MSFLCFIRSRAPQFIWFYNLQRPNTKHLLGFKIQRERDAQRVYDYHSVQDFIVSSFGLWWAIFHLFLLDNTLNKNYNGSSSSVSSPPHGLISICVDCACILVSDFYYLIAFLFFNSGVGFIVFSKICVTVFVFILAGFYSMPWVVMLSKYASPHK